MEQVRVRLTSIVIENLKNVSYGQLKFVSDKKECKISILGLYSQNASGKTVLINAIQLLKYALCGKPIPACFADYVQIGADNAKIQCTFSVQARKSSYEVFYEFKIRKELDTVLRNTVELPLEENYKVVLFDEVLSYVYASFDKKANKESIIDSRTQAVFEPEEKYERLRGKGQEIAIDLTVAKKLAAASSRSFIFSSELMSIVRQWCSGEDKFLLESLNFYGNFELFVVGSGDAGLSILPLAFRYEKKKCKVFSCMVLPIEDSAFISQDALSIIAKVIDSMNVVLSLIVPEFTLGIKDFGMQVLKDSKTRNKIQLVSCRDGKKIPLKYESEGIKKIVSVLQFLITIYNQSSITVAIDELGACVFERLLGEIIKVLSEKGKGQLIFISQNPRPLKTLDQDFIAYTTADPNNRYVRINGNSNTYSGNVAFKELSAIAQAFEQAWQSF